MTTTQTTNQYLAEYEAARAHQQHHGSSLTVFDGQPWEYCLKCLHEGRATGRMHSMKVRYAWAIPNDAALTAIADHAPRGVVEIGAGGGYWARLLRARGVDVVAYDPDPEGGDSFDGERGWHDGTRWSEVLPGDHTAVTAHPDRALLLVWPSYSEAWTDQVLDLYTGDTVIYVGEGAGGCTGTDRMHAILGADTYCWHDEDGCGCPVGEPARFEEIADVGIPQWAGLHDRLGVYRRRRPTAPPATAGSCPP